MEDGLERLISSVYRLWKNKQKPKGGCLNEDTLCQVARDECRQVMPIVAVAGCVGDAGQEASFCIQAHVLFVPEEVLCLLDRVPMLVVHLLCMLRTPRGVRVVRHLAFVLALVVLGDIDIGDDMHTVQNLQRPEGDALSLAMAMISWRSISNAVALLFSRRRLLNSDKVE